LTKWFSRKKEEGEGNPVVIYTVVYTTEFVTYKIMESQLNKGQIGEELDSRRWDSRTVK